MMETLRTIQVILKENHKAFLLFVIIAMTATVFEWTVLSGVKTNEQLFEASVASMLLDYIKMGAFATTLVMVVKRAGQKVAPLTTRSIVAACFKMLVTMVILTVCALSIAALFIEPTDFLTTEGVVKVSDTTRLIANSVTMGVVIILYVAVMHAFASYLTNRQLKQVAKEQRIKVSLLEGYCNGFLVPFRGVGRLITLPWMTLMVAGICGIKAGALYLEQADMILLSGVLKTLSSALAIAAFVQCYLYYQQRYLLSPTIKGMDNAPCGEPHA
jgi:hypothetical protein